MPSCGGLKIAMGVFGDDWGDVEDEDENEEVAVDEDGEELEEFEGDVGNVCDEGASLQHQIRIP